MEAIVNSVSFSFNRIIVELSGMDYLYFIDPKQVDWFPIDKDGNTYKTELNVGSSIEFDLISNATRNLINVKIVKKMKEIEILEKLFNEHQLNVIKSTVKYGGWGDADVDTKDGGDYHGYGYCTSEAKKGVNNLTNRQIAGVYSGIVKILNKNNIEFMKHFPDYWGEGKTSDGMLFFDYEIHREIEKWASNK